MMKTALLAGLLVVGLGVSGALAQAMDFTAVKDAGITTLGEHTNRGADSHISFCNGSVNSGEFGVFAFDRAAIQAYINSRLGGLTLQQAVDMSWISVSLSVVAAGNVDPHAQVGVTSVYTDDNWVESTCTAASPNDLGQGYNWHRTDTSVGGQQLKNIPGVENSTLMTGWGQNVRTSVQLDDALWVGYIYGVDSNDTSRSVPASTMLKTYGFAASGMTCYTKEAGAAYAPKLTVWMELFPPPPPPPNHPGDFDRDGMVYIPDWEFFFGLHTMEYQFPDPRDIDGDGVVTVNDLGIFARNYGLGVPRPGPNTSPGDINCDGKVDVIDLGVLAKNYDSNWSRYAGTQEGFLGVRCYGDLNGDWKVDVVDLAILAQNYDSVTAGQNIPEPASLSLLGLGLAALLRRRR